MPLRNIYTYETVMEMLGNRRMSRIANNTYAAIPTSLEPCIDITLHLSHIVTLLPDGTVVIHIPLDPHERTKTTRDRINRFLPDEYTLFVRDKDWWIQDDRLDVQWPVKPGTTYYFDWPE